MNLANILRILKQKLYNRDVAVFLIFLFLALFVWFLNKLSHDYLYAINYPVELYSKSKQITFDEKNAVLTVQQRMDGFAILKSKVSRTPVIRIDLSAEKYQRVPSTPNTYYLLTKSFSDIIGHQIGDDRQLVAIVPDTLFFDIGTLVQKKVPVRHQLNITTEKEYMLKDSIALTPDSITISGSEAAVNGVTHVVGAPKTLLNLANPTEDSFDLLPIKNIHFSSDQIRYRANIIRYTEGIINAAIEVKDLPTEASITLLPNEVELRYRVALSDFSLIDTAQFSTSVSYNDIADNNDRTLPVKVTRKPKEVLSVHITPPFVEYIIRKN